MLPSFQSRFTWVLVGVLTVLTLFSSQSSQAQAYHPLLRHDVLWEVGDHHFGIGLTLWYEYYVLDSTQAVQIDGVTYQQPKQGVYLREDSIQRKVYYRTANDTTDHVYYDFSLQVGDSIESPPHGMGLWLTVSYVGTTTVGGESRKYLSLVDPTGNLFYSTYWIEGVGSASGLVYSAANSCNECEDHLMCYRYLNGPLDQPLWGNVCTPVGTREAESESAIIKIIPNPSTGQSKVMWSGESVESVVVADLQGRLVHRESVALGQSSSVLTLKDLQPGMYIVRLEGKHESWYRHWVVTH